MLRFYWLTVGVLATWRITHLLHAEDGPWDLMVRLRRAAGKSFWGGLLDCFYCLSVWLAAPISYFIGSDWFERVLLWPALSGAAILLEKAPAKPQPPMARYFEDPEEKE